MLYLVVISAKVDYDRGSGVFGPSHLKGNYNFRALMNFFCWIPTSAVENSLLCVQWGGGVRTPFFAGDYLFQHNTNNRAILGSPGG